MASNEMSPRMTRENYFKIAESQGLGNMRDEMISIGRDTTTENDNNIQNSTIKSGFGKNKTSNSALVSIVSIDQLEKSNLSSEHHVASEKRFKRRH